MFTVSELRSPEYSKCEENPKRFVQKKFPQIFICWSCVVYFLDKWLFIKNGNTSQVEDSPNSYPQTSFHIAEWERKCNPVGQIAMICVFIHLDKKYQPSFALEFLIQLSTACTGTLAVVAVA